MEKVLTTLASLVLLSAVYAYFVKVRAKASIPNPSTWLIWIIINVINTITYFLVLKGDLWTSFITVVATGGMLFLFIYSATTGKFAAVGKVEILCFLLALAVGIVWQVTKNHVLANLLLQGVYIISFVPTVVGLLRKQIKEHPLPWTLAFSAYCFTIAAILMTWTPDSWTALAHPIANGLLGNGSVAAIAFWQQSQRTKTLGCNKTFRRSA